MGFQGLGLSVVTREGPGRSSSLGSRGSPQAPSPIQCREVESPGPFLSLHLPEGL